MQPTTTAFICALCVLCGHKRSAFERPRHRPESLARAIDPQGEGFGRGSSRGVRRATREQRGTPTISDGRTFGFSGVRALAVPGFSRYKSGKTEPTLALVKPLKGRCVAPDRLGEVRTA